MWWRHLYFVFCFLISLNNADISIVDDATVGFFSIFYDELLLFQHTDETPMVQVGNLSLDTSETQGMFIITDENRTSMPLTFYDILVNETNNISISFSDDDTFQVTFSLEVVSEGEENGEEHLEFVAEITDGTTYANCIYLSLYGEADEKIFGAGEQFTYFNLKGNYFPIWTSEQGVGRDDSIIANGADADGGAGGEYYNTYWPQASYMSKRGYSIFVNNYEYLVLDFTEEESNQVYVKSTSITGSILKNDTIQELVPRISTFIGTQANLPDWILKGSIIGLEEDGTEEMLSRYDEIVSAGVDVSALWIQDWSGTTEVAQGHRVYWNWEWNETYYEGLNTSITDLYDEGVRMMVYCNPHLIEGSEMFIEADQNGYFFRNESGDTYLQDFGGFMGGTIDLFNEEAYEWYKNKLSENMIDLGIKGWMSDFGEYTATDMISSNSEVDQGIIHNMYPVLWAQMNQEMVNEANVNDPEEIVYFSRSGALGASSHLKLSWAGDQNVDFSIADGVASTVVAALSLAVSGMGVTHFDIGGFTTIQFVLTRSEELLLRSAEYAAFTPVMRTHLGNYPEYNDQIYDSPETLRNFARLTQIHSRLFDYTREIVTENAVYGVPVQRPMFYHYEFDEDAWDIMYQYMYGPDLIVAPVIDEGQVYVDVYIPEGDNATWVPLWSEAGESGYMEGPLSVTILAPIGFPAVFYRLDSPFSTLFESINADFGGASP